MNLKRRVFLPLIVLFSSIILYLFQIGLFKQASPLLWINAFVYLLLAWWFGREYDMLKVDSEQDFLTNLYNRKKVQPVFHKLTKRADMKSGKVVAFFIDLDNFKMINDRLDHRTGDLVLQEIAEDLQNVFGGEHEYVFRWGGDEFLVLLVMDNTSNIEMLKNLLLQKVYQHHHNFPIKVTISLGHAIYPDEGTHLHEILSVADQRMYQQKSPQPYSD